MDILLRLTYCMGVLAVGAMAIIAFWLVYPYNPLTINNVETHTKVTQAGGLFEYSVDFCKHTDLPAKLDKTFVDGIVFHLPQAYIDGDEGCRTDNVIMEVPEFFDGEYHVEVLLTYQVNPIRKEIVKVETDKFIVLPK